VRFVVKTNYIAKTAKPFTKQFIVNPSRKLFNTKRKVEDKEGFPQRYDEGAKVNKLFKGY
jgi:hypothetical protein